MSIRRKLATFIFLMTGFMAFMGGLLLVGGPAMVNVFRTSLDSMNSLDSIRELRSNVSRQRVSFNRYLLVDEPQELISFEEASRGVQKKLDAMRTQMKGAVPSWFSELEDLFTATDKAAHRVTARYKQGNKASALDEATAEVFPKFQKLFELVSTIERDRSVEAQQTFERVRNLSEQVEYIVLLAFALAFVFSIVLFRSLYKAVIDPLSILRKGTEEFGRGHWDYRIDLPSTNEFGALANSFNTMAENVKQLQLQAVHMDRMSAVGQLAGGVAHEINNPLTAVLGQTQILLAKVPETDMVHAQLQKVEAAALRCKKIVRGLLDFSRPSQSSFEDIDVNGIIGATLDLCEADLKKAKINVEKRTPRELPKIEGNSSELQQVLLNLINNAIQAMPRGGTLTLNARMIPETPPRDRNRQGSRFYHGPWMEIVVRDTGVGIAKEHLSRVFEPFFTTKEVGKGTGLGLAVSLGIVQKHGGELKVESPGLNRGATFSILLPMKRNALVSHSVSDEQRGMAA